MADDDKGNGTGYIEGLDITMYKNPSQSDFDNVINATGGKYDTEEQYLSNIYNYTANVDTFTSPVPKAPFSMGNRYALFTYIGLHGNYSDMLNKYYKLMINNPIHGGNTAKNPTVNNIIEFFADRDTSGGIEYDYADFIWCKYFKKIPNNHLITLRRFTQPIEDNIYKVIRKTFTDDAAEQAVKDKKIATDKTNGFLDTINVDITQPDVARALTWFGENTSNSLEELLTFSYGYNWAEQSTETNTLQSNDEGYTAHPFYEKMGVKGQSAVDLMRGVDPGTKYKRQLSQGYDPLLGSYPNFVVGPVNVINKMRTRDVGLNFDHNIKLIFEYELRSYHGVDPKIGLLDIMSNLLVLTYDNAGFWGGANRFYGAAGFVARRFGDDSKLRQGDFKGYLGSLIVDVSTGLQAAFGIEGGGFTLESLLEGFKKLGSTFIGNMMGKLINSQLGAPPAYQQLKGMITGEATGNWHLTVGNPMNPIVMMGNLILENSTLSFSGNLGYNDFPENIKLEVELKHARPRDKTDIESMFNAGKGRIYSSSSDFMDILNLRGSDVDVYGAFRTSKDADTNVNNGNMIGPPDFENIALLAGVDQQNAKQIGKNAYWVSRTSVDYMDKVDAHMHY